MAVPYIDNQLLADAAERLFETEVFDPTAREIVNEHRLSEDMPVLTDEEAAEYVLDHGLVRVLRSRGYTACLVNGLYSRKYPPTTLDRAKVCLAGAGRGRGAVRICFAREGEENLILQAAEGHRIRAKAIAFRNISERVYGAHEAKLLPQPAAVLMLHDSNALAVPPHATEIARLAASRSNGAALPAPPPAE